jgi:hypothetical protein
MKKIFVRHKQHSFRVYHDKFSYRSYPGLNGCRNYNFKCERCGTTGFAHREGEHWKGWDPKMPTCGDVLTREVHES